MVNKYKINYINQRTGKIQKKPQLYSSYKFFLKKKEKEKRPPAFQHPVSTGLGVGGARASALEEGIGVEFFT